MTRQKASELAEWLLKLLVPLFIAICAYIFQEARAEMQLLRSSIQDFQARLEALNVEIVAMKTRFEYHERVQ